MIWSRPNGAVAHAEWEQQLAENDDRGRRIGRRGFLDELRETGRGAQKARRVMKSDDSGGGRGRHQAQRRPVRAGCPVRALP